MSSGNNAVPNNTIILAFFVPFLSTALDFRRTHQWRLYGEAEGATVTRILAGLYPVGQKTASFFLKPCSMSIIFWHTDTWMNFLSPAYIIFFVDSSTENQLNILFVYLVADDSISSSRFAVKKIAF